ncbi:xylulose kinase-like [Macrosteles quadrilineatus]|uniref:xylulose kinase-like n=1 Tax=Macrosteles quadrilineatus TaxID=74068 RepID=UPI0023E1DA08|nr:xylulose kinase-like [Macrosteles quadrilineatus]
MTENEDATYLGLDFSTQQLKGVIVNKNLEVIHETNVQFDSVLPEFRTHSGVVRQDKKTVTAPVLMWVKALDLLLDQLKVCGADFSQIAALSGSAQQHGTVYWQVGAEETLKTLDPDSFLHTQLASAFSVTSSPVWMDSSTSLQCRQLEEHVGGAQKLAEISGSRAYERFSAAQIMKIAQSKPSTYANTERISLVSSFACSLFLGRYAPIDLSDGSGMNLLDIHSKSWSQDCLKACAEDLASRLGEPVPSHSDLGCVSDYMVERHSFNPSCRVIAFTGDNPSSLAGMTLRPGDVAVSLGTSDTLFLPLTQPPTLPEGHVLINPVDSDAYMALLCFKNGSLTRERIRNFVAEKSWERFSSLLNSTPRGNFGNFGLYYDAQEIIPFVQGDFRWDKSNSSVTKFTPETEVRALLEGQFIAKRAHAEDLGFIVGKDSRILATGGGSANKEVLQVLADCFNTNVYTMTPRYSPIKDKSVSQSLGR